MKNVISNFELVPNPANSSFSLIFSDINTLKNIAVYTVLGELIYHTTNKIGTNERIDVSAWPNGVYIVETNTAFGKERKKLIKN